MSVLLNHAGRGRSSLIRSFLRRTHATAKHPRTSYYLGAGSDCLRRSWDHSLLQSAPFHHISRFPSKVPSARSQLDPDLNSNPTTTATSLSSDTEQANGLAASSRQALQQLGIVNGKIRVAPIRRRSPRRRNKRYQQHSIRPDFPPNQRVRVKSVHAAATLDVVAVLSKVFGQKKHHASRHMFGKNSVIVQLPPLNDEEHSRFVAVFRFGSVVFFNVSPREAGKLLEIIKKHGTDPVASGFERKEHFEVVIAPQQQHHLPESEPAVNGDYCLVESLEMNSVAVISNIMAQTVALDSYSDIVDELLANFASINAIVTRTGNFTEMEKTNLFKVVAQNNSLFIDMISKLGIKDRSDTAWNLSQYEQVHEGLKAEFEILDRFEHIEVKLETISHNAKFFLEILHNQKSNSLEIIIIVLITFECVLMCLDMSGTGGSLFSAVPALSFLPKAGS